MLARAIVLSFGSARRGATRLLHGAAPRPLRWAGPAALVAAMLAACAPVLSAAPAVTATDAAAEQAGTLALAPAPDTALTLAPSPDAALAPSPDAALTLAPSPDPALAPADPAATDQQPGPSAAASPADPPAGGAALAAGIQVGLASWYGPNFAGRLTSDGEIFDPNKLTAAHRTLPFGTLVKVTNLVNGRSVVVRINDRGPFKPNRIIDLSRAAAEAIDMVRMGVAKVRLEPLSLPNGVVRLGVGSQLQRYQVLSRFHHVGQLLLLSKRNGADAVVVRVVGTDVPPSTGADVLVSSELYALIGAEAHVQER